MMRSIFGGRLGIIGVDRIGRDRKPKQWRLQAGVEGLESRNLMSVFQSGAAVTVTPAAGGDIAVVVSLRNDNGVTKVDVKLNNINYDFPLGKVSLIYLDATGMAGNMKFTNETALESVVYASDGNNILKAGHGSDEFIGGKGQNDFYAGDGYTLMAGGPNANVYHEINNGSGVIFKGSGSNEIIDPADGNYEVI